MSRDSVAHLLDKAARRAAKICASLAGKRVSPHVLRHTCAMQLLQAGVDRSVIALWLGHESVETTQIYLHADLTMKERALALTAQPRTSADRKSTRLNSSHGYISYAVFCLKKKKQKHTPIQHRRPGGRPTANYTRRVIASSDLLPLPPSPQRLISACRLHVPQGPLRTHRDM